LARISACVAGVVSGDVAGDAACDLVGEIGKGARRHVAVLRSTDV